MFHSFLKFSEYLFCTESLSITAYDPKGMTCVTSFCMRVKIAESPCELTHQTHLPERIKRQYSGLLFNTLSFHVGKILSVTCGCSM